LDKNIGRSKSKSQDIRRGKSRKKKTETTEKLNMDICLKTSKSVPCENKKMFMKLKNE
jgi:hypothetical protein